MAIMVTPETPITEGATFPTATVTPSGSVGVDAVYPIPLSNLALLANSTQSSLLAVSNLGSAISSRIISTLDLIDALSAFESYLIEPTILNSLANNGTSTAISVPNIGTASRVKVIVILGEITPSGSAKIAISNMTTTYELSMPLTTSEKRLEFNNIPSGFVSNFYVKNNTGVPLASYGNSIVVIPL